MKSLFKKKKRGGGGFRDNFLTDVMIPLLPDLHSKNFLNRVTILFTNQMSLMIGLLYSLPCQLNTNMNRGNLSVRSYCYNKRSLLCFCFGSSYAGKSTCWQQYLADENIVESAT